MIDCEFCSQHVAGELLVEHYNLTKCAQAKSRLEVLGMINSSEQEEVAPSSAPKHSNK